MSLGLAILGAGRIGQVHASAISRTKGAKLVAISDPFEDAAKAVQAEYGCDIRTISEIESSDDIDGVLICTPTDTHADLIERFVRVNKAVFCEKPIDLNVDRVRECLSVVDECNGTLMVGFNRRFDPDFQALKSAIDAGKIGSVEMVTITSRDPGPPPYEYIERSGGIFRDMTIHDFDIARWLLDEPVTSVTAVGSVLVDSEIGKRGDFDSVNVILRTAAGKQCVITNSRRAAYGYDQRIEVLGSDGAVAVENVFESRVEVSNSDGFHRPPLENFFLTRYMDAYEAEISAFVRAVSEGATVPTTGDDGLQSLRLADAALQSAASSQTVHLD